MRDPDLMTVHEAARQMHVSPNTVRAMLDDGRLTRVEIPGTRCVRVRACEVDRIVNPKEVE